METSPVRVIGFWAAVSSVIFAIAYAIPQLLSLVKILPYPQELTWLLLPSLFLAPAFLITMICLHYSAGRGFQIWTAIGVAFSILYCADVTMVYFIELSVGLPAQLRAEHEANNIFLFEGKTFMVALDCLGYFFMSVATFSAAFAFRKKKWLYRGLLYTGLLMPLLILAFFFPVFLIGGALWIITLPLAMINAAFFFKNSSSPQIRLKPAYKNSYENK